MGNNPAFLIPEASKTIELIPLIAVEGEEGVFAISRRAPRQPISKSVLEVAFDRGEEKLRWAGFTFPVPVYVRGNLKFVASEV